MGIEGTDSTKVINYYQVDEIAEGRSEHYDGLFLNNERKSFCTYSRWTKMRYDSRLPKYFIYQKALNCVSRTWKIHPINIP